MSNKKLSDKLVKTMGNTTDMQLENSTKGQMKTVAKTKEHLISEITKLQEKCNTLETSLKECTRSETSFRLSEEKFRSIADYTPDGVIIADKEGKIIYWNEGAKNIFGYGTKEMLGREVFLLTKEFYRKRDEKRLKAAVKAGKVSITGKVYEAVAYKKNGAKFYCEASFSSFKHDENVYITGIFRDTTKRKKVEEELRRHKEELEELVQERTIDIAKKNKQLTKEIEERKGTEKKLVKREKELNEKSRNLEEINTALKVLLERRENDKNEFGDNVVSNVKELISPYLERLKKGHLNPSQMNLLDILELNINNIVSPFVGKLSSKFINLTPMEIKVANLIKEAKTNKEIAELLLISLNTVLFHRYNIRSKLGIKNKKINLRTQLLSFDE